jgi:hypothetical protein
MAFLVAAVAVAITAAAAGALPPGHAAGQAATSAPSPTPSPGPGGGRSARNRTVRTLVLAAEAQVLGMKPAELASDLRSGMAVGQLAAQKGLSEAAFRAALAQAAQPLLDQAVARNAITEDEERAALRQIDSGRVPGWTLAPPARTPRSGPSPSVAPMPG